MSIEAIIWDWNGTLLNDTHVSVQTINQLLQERQLATLTQHQYLEVFTFPVSDYYQKIGFDFTSEPFDIPARQYIDLYGLQVDSCKLHADAYACLNRFKALGLKQFILSAMEQSELSRTVALTGIDHFFESLNGLDNHYAVSKVEVGRRLMAEHNLNPGRTLLIGDTLHDFEVAGMLGCQSILVANGHQSRARLEATGAQVVDQLAELVI